MSLLDKAKDAIGLNHPSKSVAVEDVQPPTDQGNQTDVAGQASQQEAFDHEKVYVIFVLGGPGAG
jgi:hypothetical protein